MQAALQVPAEPAPILRLEGLDDPSTEVHTQPFAFLTARTILRQDAAQALERDFPDYPEAGFFPHRIDDCGPAVNQLIAESLAPAFADALGDKLGVANLSARPALVTLCSRLHRRHGTIHCDSRSKVVTALIYLNHDWPHGSAGCLRFLRRIDDIHATLVPELLPVYGHFAAFARAEDSFHGHLPFEGPRRVIQIAWLTSHEELHRKSRRGKLTRWLKRALGPLDRRFGAGRDIHKAHPD